MSQVSKIKLSKSTEKQLTENLSVVLATITNQTEMTSFLNSFLTNTEKLMLAKRLGILLLLSEDISDTKISQTLHVTRITTAKMRYYCDLRGKESLTIALSKINTNKQLQTYKKFLLSLAKYSIKAAGGRI